MKKENIQIIIGIAGLGLAVLALSPKGGASDSGYGGAFPIPVVEGAGTPTGAAVVSSGTQSGFEISNKILDAMYAASTKKDATIGTVQPTGAAGAVSLSGLDTSQSYSLTDFGKNLSGLGLHTQSVYEANGLVYLKPNSGIVGGGLHAIASVTKKEASSSGGGTFGYQSSTGGGYGGVAASGGSAGASGYRSGGSGSWTSAGYTTRY